MEKNNVNDNIFEKDVDYVTLARKNILKLVKRDKSNEPIKTREGNYQFDLTTSKIRKILSMVNEIYNDAIFCEDDKLTDTLNDKLLSMKIRLVYECGREKTVKDFEKATYLLKYLDCVKGSKSRFLIFAQYLEALVAYHKFLLKIKHILHLVINHHY